MNPLLTVVIISWNTEDYIWDCIRSVLHSDYPNLEIIVIDNASSDNTKSHLPIGSRNYPIKTIINDRNYGCPYAENQGIALAKGKYISIICGDSKVEPAYFSEIVKIMEADSTIGAVGAKMLVMNTPYKKIDSVGEYLNQYGLLEQRHAGQEIDQGQFEEQTEIFGIKGAGLTARVDVLKEVGGFPKDYFMFLEETDTCWRIWLAGYRIVFAPKAIIYHATSTSINKHPEKDYLVKYLGTRNYIYTCLKNYGLKNLLCIMPCHILMWLGVACYMLLNGRFRHSWYVFKGVSWSLFNIGYVLKNRKQPQEIRRVTDKEIMLKIMRKVSLMHLIEKAMDW